MISIIQTIKEVLHKIQDYNNQKLKVQQEQDKINKYKQDITSLNNKLASITKDKNALASQVKTLLKKKQPISIESLKTYYENKYFDAPYYYNWGQGKQDVKNILHSKNTQLLKDTANNIAGKYKCDTPTKCVEAVMKWALKSKFKYVSDHGEQWRRADQVMADMRDDCDGLAVLMHELTRRVLTIKGFKGSYWRLKYTTGQLLGEAGHAFNIWLHDDGEWYAVESTYDLRGSLMKTWLKTPIRNNNLYVYYWGFARTDKSWVGSSGDLIPYKED